VEHRRPAGRAPLKGVMGQHVDFVTGLREVSREAVRPNRLATARGVAPFEGERDTHRSPQEAMT
jgi:hypothetical protein